MQDNMQDFINLANHLADEAGKIIRLYFRQPMGVDSKADDSPVTIADKAVEQHLRSLIDHARPDDGIVGEEFGVKQSKNQYDWVLDPIDGTKSFIAGRPTFGTLIALCEDGVPILGIIDQPILKERWVGAKDQPTTFNAAPVQTRKCDDVSKARLASTSPSWIKNEWEDLRAASDFMIWGGDCYSFGLLASGHLDAVLEQGLSPYDFAALPPIINGAGGHMCGWNGAPLTLKSEGRVLALGDTALKEPLLEFLNISN